MAKEALLTPEKTYKNPQHIGFGALERAGVKNPTNDINTTSYSLKDAPNAYLNIDPKIENTADSLLITIDHRKEHYNELSKTTNWKHYEDPEEYAHIKQLAHDLRPDEYSSEASDQELSFEDMMEILNDFAPGVAKEVALYEFYELSEHNKGELMSLTQEDLDAKNDKLGVCTRILDKLVKDQLEAKQEAEDIRQIIARQHPD